MNVYLQMGSCYKYDLAEWLIDNLGIENVFMDYYKNYFDDSNEYLKSDRIHFLPTEVFRDNNAVDDYDITDYPMPSNRIMVDALQFESMAIRMDMRESNFPINTYDEGRRRYLFYLRLWNKELEEKKIDFIFFEEAPHDICLYVLYVVAQIRGIKTFFMNPTGITTGIDHNSVYVYGNTIDGFGKDIEVEYNCIKDKKDDYKLGGVFSEFINKTLTGNCDVAISNVRMKKIAKFIYETEFKRYDASCPFFKDIYLNLRCFFAAILKYQNITLYWNNKPSKRKKEIWARVSIFKRYNCLSLKNYDRIASYPALTEPFIYFPLQLYPECTLFPLADNYADQYNSIQMLSRICAKYEIKIYVKEHYLQPYRTSSFWKDIIKLKNVILIKSSVPSNILWERCFAVASQTGTILMEAVLHGKPALVFGGGYYWKSMPGLFEIKSEEEGKSIIEGLINNDDKYKFTLQQVKKYFYAIENNSLEYYVATKDNKTNLIESKYNLCLDNLKRLIKKELKAYV